MNFISPSSPFVAFRESKLVDGGMMAQSTRIFELEVDSSVDRGTKKFCLSDRNFALSAGLVRELPSDVGRLGASKISIA